MVKTNRASALEAPAVAKPLSEGALHFPKMAASAASHRPIKGILKNKGSTASSMAAPAQQSGRATQVSRKKSQRWDESNILATCRPSYKEYDVMEMNEPHTFPLNMQEGREDMVCDFEAKDPTEDMTIDILAKKLASIDTSESSCKMEKPESYKAHTKKIILDKQEKRRQFELKRKLHYSQGLNIKLARQLIARDFQREEMENENEQCSHVTNEKKTSAEEPHENLASDELQT